MPSETRRKPKGTFLGRWFKRLVLTLVVIQVVWLVVINAALSLSLTQDMVNRIKPEKFQVRFERAWSWYPGHLTATKAFANGQSRRQQWQASVDRVNAHISLLGLIGKRVNINWGEAENADYRQRPRLKPDVDYSGLLEHFPDIEGFPVVPVSDDPLPERRPWKVHLEDLQVTGKHHLWIKQIRAEFEADIAGGLDVETRGGPFEMDLEQVDINLQGAWLNTDQTMVNDGQVSGSFGFSKFRPRENKGLPMLGYVRADLELSLNTRRLDFINLFLLNFDSVSVDGSGAIEGRLVLDSAEVRPGTDLHVDADDLAVQAFSLLVTGSGDIDLSVRETESNPMVLDFSFDDLLVQHEEDDSPMLEGEELDLRLSGTPRIHLSMDSMDMTRTFAVDIDGLRVPDLARFQRFIPEKWPFVLHGGTGSLEGEALLGPNVLSTNLRLASEEADLGLRQYRFDSDLDAVLQLENLDIQNQATELSGTYIKLSDSRLQREQGEVSKPWEASLEIDTAELSLIPIVDKQNDATSFDLLKLLGNRDARVLLADSTGEFDFKAYVSSLAFLSVFLSDKEPAEVQGDGEIFGQVFLDSGLPAAGTDVEIRSTALGVKIIDYFAQGNGLVKLNVEEGGEYPDWRLAVRLEDAQMRRLGSETPGVEEVELLLDALVEDVSFQPRERSYAIRFQLPSAKVPDMSIFNGYLPPEAPLAFASGTADLAVDLNLEEDDASGFVRLFGENIDVSLEQQELQADLLANLLIVGGTPSEMMFDLAGSTVALDNVGISGDTEEFSDEAWSARLTLEKADVTWAEPPKMDLEAQLHMSDTRPFAALLRNNGGSRLVSRILTVDEVEGKARLTAQDHRMRIPSLEVTGEDTLIGMKGLITREQREGMIFMRWKALRSVLKVNDGKKNLDVINARETFDAYSPPE